MRLRNSLLTLVLTLNCFCFFPSFACDGSGRIELHTVETSSLKGRPIYIEFNVQNNKFVFVRAAAPDENGFILKDKHKSPAERKKFETQFDIASARTILKSYALAEKLNAAQFKDYQFGLFSIYQLDEERSTFVGEVTLGDEHISSECFAEMTIDLDPSFRYKKIGRTVVETVLDKIFVRALGQKPLVINYLALRGPNMMATKVFTSATAPLKMLKSKVHFDNLPSHHIYQRLGFCPWHISIDCSLVWVYPPAPTKILPQAMPYVNQLTSADEIQRNEGIEILTNSVKMALQGQTGKK